MLLIPCICEKLQGKKFAREAVMESSLRTTDDVVEEIMRLHRSLPARPGIDEIEAAKTLIRNVEREDQLKLEGIAKQSKGKDVPEELFKILQELRRNMIHFQSKEQKTEALKLLDLESVHMVFDDLIQRASRCLPGSTDSQYSESVKASYSSSSSLSPAVNTTATASASSSSSSFYNEKENTKASEVLFTKDDTYVKKAKTAFHRDVFGIGNRSGDISPVPQIVDPTLKPAVASGEFQDQLWLWFKLCF